MKAKSEKKRRAVLEEIEPRILYSADFAPALADAAAFVPEAEQRTLEPSGEFIQASTQDTQSRRHDIVFVDPATPDYQKLIDDIRAQDGDADIEVVLLDVERDGIEQISQTLAGRRDISAMHLISHGAEGSVQLGSSLLNFDSLLQNAKQIKGWGQALTVDADLLIYGCDVAGSTEGKSLVDALARLTGADVAASVDPTGTTQQGGDWILEYQVGEVGTGVIVSISAQLDWRGTLAAPTAANDSYTVNEDATLDANTQAWQFREKLTFNNASRPENLVNMPVLVKLDNTRIDYAATQANGADLRFYDPDGSALAYEIESWTPGGTSYVWVKVPQIDASSSTDFIWMAYGNPSATDAQNSAGVWDAQYQDVWHLDEVVTDEANTATHVDVTSGASNGSQSGNNDIAGKFAPGQDFDGIDDYVQTTSSILKTANSFSISLWFNADATDFAHHLLWQGDGTGNGFGEPIPRPQEMSLSLGGISPTGVSESNMLSFNLGDTDQADDPNVLAISTAFSDTAGWHHVVVNVSNLGIAPSAEMYLDGALVGSDTGTTARTQRTNWDTDMRLGAPGAPQRYYDGALDEVRISTSTRSNNWVSAEYASANDTLIGTYGAQVTQAGVLSNDFDVDGQTLTAVLDTTTTNGALTLSSNGSFTYTPNANFFGTDTFTYHAFDGTSSSAVRTATITVNPVNDAPVASGSATLAAVAENTANPAGATVSALFGGNYSDATDAGNATALSGVAIIGDAATAGQGAWQYSSDGSTWSNVPTAGLANATALVLPASYYLRFVPAADYNGTPGSLTVRLSDSSAGAIAFNPSSNISAAIGGTGNWSSATVALGTSVTAVNDAPTITNAATVSLTGTNEDTTSSGTTVNTILTGASWADVDSGALKGIAVTAVTGNGTWQYSTDGITWTNFGSVSGGSALLLDSASQVRYVPDGQNGETATFGFKAWDQTTGTASANGSPSTVNPGAGGGSSAYSSQNASASIVVSAINDAPTITGTQAGQAVNDTGTINPFAGVSIGDVDNPAQTLTVSVTLDTAAKGVFSTLNGFTDAGGGVYTFSGTAAAATTAIHGLVFDPADNRVAPGSTETTTFTISVDDGSAAVTDNTTTVVSTSVNDAPTGADAGISIDEDSSYIFTTADFGFADVDASDSLQAVRIVNVPGQGSLILSGGAVGAGQLISAADIILGELVYTPAPDSSGVGYASFDFRVNDGTADALAMNTITIDVTPINDAPSFTQAGNQNVDEDAGGQIVPGFASGAPGGGADEAGQLLSYTVSNDNNALFSVQPSIDAAGNLTYTTAANANGVANVTVLVSDNGGTANGGVDATPAQIFTITVAAVNDAPVLGANALTVDQGQSVILSVANLSASDVDTAAGVLNFAVSNVSNGQFELVGAPGVAVIAFTQAEVAAGQVVFVHDGSSSAPAYDLQVDDGALTDGPFAASVLFNQAPPVVIVPILPPVPEPAPVPVVTPPAPPAVEPAPAEDATTAPPARPGRAPAVFSPGRPETPAGDGTVPAGLAPALAPVRIVQTAATPNTFEPAARIDPTLQLLAVLPANLQYLPSVPADWTTQTAFPDGEEPERSRIEVLLEQVELGGMALSVGVVWWASRISGLLGSLLASAPAWRHIDPLPVVGRDEDEEKKWYDPDDRDADANELAIANVLEGAHAHSEPGN